MFADTTAVEGVWAGTKRASCSDRAAVFLVVALLHKPSHFLLDLERDCCTIRPIPDPLRCFGKPPVFDSREDGCCCFHWIFPPLWGHPPTPSLLRCAVFPIGMIRKGASTSRVSSKVRPCWASIASSRMAGFPVSRANCRPYCGSCTTQTAPS